MKSKALILNQQYSKPYTVNQHKLYKTKSTSKIYFKAQEARNHQRKRPIIMEKERHIVSII